MTQFRKLKITITHLETSTGNHLTEMKVKGSSRFTLEEINTLANKAKREFFENIQTDLQKNPNVLKSA